MLNQRRLIYFQHEAPITATSAIRPIKIREGLTPKKSGPTATIAKSSTTPAARPSHIDDPTLVNFRTQYQDLNFPHTTN